MILCLELTARDNYHAPFNAAFLRTICAAFPEEAVEYHADATHLPHIRDMLGEAPVNLRLDALALGDPCPERPWLSTFRRLWRDLSAILRLIRRQPHGERLALVVSSASASAIVAARLAQAMLWPRRVCVQVPLHGELSSINGWRSRNPFYRAIDLRSAIARCHGSRFRYLVFERAVRDALAREFPGTKADIDALLHPVNECEMAARATPRPGEPVRIALLGVATWAKGFDIYLDAAATLAREHPGRLEFHAIGRLHPDLAGLDITPLTGGIGRCDLPRSEFRRRLAEVHFVCLPFRAFYYGFAASGTLIDAIGFGKPVLAIADGALAAVLRDAGDIGYACHDPEALVDILRALARNPAPFIARYPAQVEAMQRLRRARTPASLAPLYRATLGDFAEAAGYPRRALRRGALLGTGSGSAKA